MTEQLTIESYLARTDRQGSTFDHALDGERLNRQEALVYEVMKHGGWFTLREIADETGQPEASISARIRDFKNIHHMSTAKRRRGLETRGLWEYAICSMG